MIPAPYRMKGAALALGARTAGEIGPFGPFGGDAVRNVDERGQREPGGSPVSAPQEEDER
ncbi:MULTISPECIES: hypothetical protein [Streptomyces]|uniref:Uncharacterized protein n=2 Tax=Streptomyces TaxID=1883 RepID=A0A1E7LWX0_9ACTN|nr:hypothetical protein [Streptomyces nanshensis]OEV20740.1 hypothetical protein AN221_11040 [Streptomyces nanshensis]